MHLIPDSKVSASAQAVVRLVQGIKQGHSLRHLADPALDLAQPTPKSLAKALANIQGPSWLYSFFISSREQSNHLPVNRLTLVGSLLARALKSSQRSMQISEICAFLSIHQHGHIPLAITPQVGATFAEGLDLLQMLAQWRWRGQARPLNIDDELEALAAALVANATPSLYHDLGRTARWCVHHDWGTGDAARRGEVTTRTFAALLKQGARIGPDLNALKFPDQMDRTGHLPVLLAVIRHAPPDQLTDLIERLLVQGAHPDALSGHGRTALMACLDSRLGEEAIAVGRALLAHGSNAAIKDSNGLSVLDHLAAIEKAHREPILKLAHGGAQSDTDTQGSDEPDAAPTSPFQFRNALVSAIQSSLARHQASSILDDIDNEIRAENDGNLAAA